MRIFITGADGYLGWSLAQYLTARGHEIAGADALYRRQWMAEMGSQSATPIADVPVRLLAFEERWGRPLDFRTGDLKDWDFVKSFFEDFGPKPSSTSESARRPPIR